MNWLQRKRFYQIIYYGWADSKNIANESGKTRLSEFISILICFKKNYVFSNQYVKNRLWALNCEDRDKLAIIIGKGNKQHDDWVMDRYHNRKFIAKWSSNKWETSPKKIHKCKMAYTKQFNAGEGLIVQRNVDIHREHYLEGTIKIGNNVLLAKNVFIDYSGDLVIHDGVALANGVIIETHTHDLNYNYGRGIKGKLDIGENVKILSRAYIADTCHSIGRYARIGAGSYVRNNIPPYAIVMGNPAKIVGFLYSPDEMKAFEADKYPEDKRTDIEKYKLYYEKYFINKTKEIRSWIKL